MQPAVGDLQQPQQQPRIQPVLSGVLPAALLSDPRPVWRGFFVAFAPWFGYYFFGYRQTPARAAARTMLQ